MLKLFGILALIPMLLLTSCSDIPSAQKASSGGYESLDNTGIGWGFVRRKGEAPDIPVTLKQR